MNYKYDYLGKHTLLHKSSFYYMDNETYKKRCMLVSW